VSAKGDESRGQQRKAFLLRLPPELHEELRRWASRDLRSLNGQIEFLLREALRRRGGGVDEEEKSVR
jgi:hypothetical protein